MRVHLALIRCAFPSLFFAGKSKFDEKPRSGWRQLKLRLTSFRKRWTEQQQMFFMCAVIDHTVMAQVHSLESVLSNCAKTDFATEFFDSSATRRTVQPEAFLAVTSAWAPISAFQTDRSVNRCAAQCMLVSPVTLATLTSLPARINKCAFSTMLWHNALCRAVSMATASTALISMFSLLRKSSRSTLPSNQILSYTH